MVGVTRAILIAQAIGWVNHMLGQTQRLNFPVLTIMTKIGTILVDLLMIQRMVLVVVISPQLKRMATVKSLVMLILVPTSKLILMVKLYLNALSTMNLMRTISSLKERKRRMVLRSLMVRIGRLQLGKRAY